MTLENSVREYCGGLGSLRATERKKSADTLKDCLTRNAVPSLLSQNTIKKKGYTWNEVFDDINEYILKETEKFESSKTFETVTKPLCSSLLQLCISGSNKGKAYIKCDKIIDACLYILKDKRLVTAVGDAYLSVLYKYVLTCDHYLAYITPSAWEDLLNECLSVCISKQCKLDGFTKMRVLLLIVKHGQSCCQFVVPLRDSLTKLKKCLLEVLEDKNMQDIVTEIMIGLSEVLSTECRLTMCEFTESLLSSILKIYDQNIDQKKKSSLFKILQLTLVLHHPQGALPNKEGSLAHDWAVWNRQLKSILEIVCLESTVLEKLRKRNDKLSKHSKEYYCLAASVYYQVFNASVPTEENENGNSSKRQRVNFNKNNSFGDLIEEMRHNCEPWLEIIHMYLEKYSTSISNADYLSLLAVIEFQITNNSNLDWNSLEEITCIVIKNLTSASNPTNAQNERDVSLISLWNSCVRMSTLVNTAHKALHTIMQLLLTLDTLNYQDVQPLLKLYFEKGMPVSDDSVKTLSKVFHIFFSKCNCFEVRLNCFTWLTCEQINLLNIPNVEELLLRLLTRENIDLSSSCKTSSELESLHEILFDSIEKCILFSEFELDIPKSFLPPEKVPEHVEMNEELNIIIIKFLQKKLLYYLEEIKTNELVLFQCIKCINLVTIYLDMLLKYKFVSENQIIEEEMFCLLKTSLRLVYLSLTNNLKNKKDVTKRIELLKCVRDILMTEFVPLLSSLVRVSITEDFFHCVNHIMNIEVSNDEESLYEGDDSEMNPHALKHICISLLAAYCRKRGDYRDEILKLLLDPTLYNFTISWDVDSAFECIDLLSHTDVEDPPIELIFTLMQYMCKDMFRDPKVSFRILRTLVKMLDQIWSYENNMRNNCFIMVKSYLQRCENSYYPPHMAALVYECAAKIVALNLKQNRDVENNFLEVILEKIKGNTHSIRLYCCYLLKLIIAHLSDAEINSHSKGLMDIFIIKVTERNETILKDESANRTLTILHRFFALMQLKDSFLHMIVTEVIQMQKEKSLDERLVKKVLNKITNNVTNQNIDVYLNENLLLILNYWCLKNNSILELPITLFGFRQLEKFVEKHLNWLIAADILWMREGDIRNSDILKLVQNASGKSVENIIEAAVCNIIVLCLPYVATKEYGLSCNGLGKPEWISNADKLFTSSRELLGAEKWSKLFAGNMSELMLLIATHLSDHIEANKQFQVIVPEDTKSYHYPKDVFYGILKFIGQLIEEDIMQYLCENKPLTLFKTLFGLWKNVLQEKIFEFKVLALHTYITFLECIPLEHSSDAFICNFACNNLAQAIKDSKIKEEINVFIKALRSVLERCLLKRLDVLRNCVSRILSILMIKKEEGFSGECATLLTYLTVDMKNYLKESEDVIDFVSSISQGVAQTVLCSSKTEFMQKIKTYKKSLECPSHETLLNMRQFLKINKVYVRQLYEELNTKGFSDDCGTSMLHQIIHTLSNILKSAADNKTTIEVCNCLIEIGNYDLKTLVMVSPNDTQQVIDMKPKQYFAIVLLTALSDVLFDESPAVTNLAAKTVKRVLKYREGRDALDLANVDKETLKPFLSTDCNATAEFRINEAGFNSLCASEHWIPNENENHSEWLTRVTVSLLDALAGATVYLGTLRAVCVSKPSVCRIILPPLLGLLLDCSSEGHIQKISHQINRFFEHIWEKNFDDKIKSSYDSNAFSGTSNVLDQDYKMIVQYVLDVVNFVRLQRSCYKPRPDRTIENLNYLRLEYNKVAWAATVADQNVWAIYYGELWAAAQNEGVPPASPEATSQLPGGDNVQWIFRKCFVSIGEMDAMEGCGTAHLTNEDEKRKHLINTGQFTDALLLHDIALSCGGQVGQELQYGAVKALHKSGMHHLALQYIKSLPESDDLNDIKYDCLSFLGDWADFVDTRDLEKKTKQSNFNSHSVIKAYRYSCLKDCLNLQTTSDFENKLILSVNRAKLAVAKMCQSLNMENCQSIYKVLSKLHLFGDIEDYFSVRCGKLPIKDLLNQWQAEKLPTYHDFKYLEALISQRSLILEYAAKAFCSSLKDIVSLQLQYAELGLSNHRVQMAQRLLAVVKKLQISPEVALADSQISWAKGHKDIALSLLRDIVANPSPDVKLAAVSLRQYGLWMAESKCENARDIINKYLKKSLEVLSGNDHEETRLKLYYDIAKFADAEYKQVVTYMNSSIFEKKVKCLESMKDTVCSLKSTQQSLNKNERKALLTSDRFGQIDEAEIASTRAEKESFLHLAMRYYLLSLKQGERNNLSIFRVISLWLDNSNLELKDSEQESFEELLHAIPSWKFITVLPQLGPRLTNERNAFGENLRRIIKRCALEHPHHTLPILFSLKNSDKDKQILNSSENVGSSAQRAPSKEPRIMAAEALVSELARENQVLSVIISQMEKMCDATISFANYVPKTKEQRQKIPIPAAERIHRLGHLDAIPIPTDNIPISIDCKYFYLPTLYSFEPYFELVGGINCPKKITCRSSDGRNRILLIKGEDDLRQDAMVQQVFNIVNTLLEKNPVTSRNKLLIRTYKVVPMSRQSGVLEWCEGTMPIGIYLAGTREQVGSHVRLRPRDITPSAARLKLEALHSKRRSAQDKLTVFLRILKEFRPVFHYFFTEHFLDPVTWYERRLAYTKSVATSSMVGYIMGLGDRHLQNILIDKKTAEVVHIDFGIAFDQGKTLPTPETIPFRLTQDIIAGFGSSGVEGVFRRCCEKTMELLRDNQETLLTILEVLLCDPLYSWRVTSKQQNVLTAPSGDATIIQTSGGDGSLAKRALLTVSSKLSGTEGGVAGGVAVPGQVARLINSATDSGNLSRLYPGWQPYL